MENEVKSRKNRILEIDLLRGGAIFLMVLHHLIFDLRYIVGLDVFAFQETEWFQIYLRSAVLAVFILVSGISSSFSRNNLRRGIRLLIAALILTGGSLLVNHFSQVQLGVIVFNVFHVLALSIISYALLEKILWSKEDKEEKRFQFFLILLVLGSLLIFVPELLRQQFGLNSPLLNIIFFAEYPQGMALLDNMPLFPWLGFSLIGSAMGLLLYRERRSLFSEPGPRAEKLFRPICFLGRNALWVYLFHQPIILAVLWLLGQIGILPRI